MYLKSIAHRSHSRGNISPSVESKDKPHNESNQRESDNGWDEVSGNKVYIARGDNNLKITKISS